MASVEKRTDRGEDSWLVRWRDPEGRQRKKTFTRAAEARRYAAIVEADMARGQYVNLAQRITVAEYARSWATSGPIAPPPLAARPGSSTTTSPAPGWGPAGWPR